jgi:hypothetical protein
MAIGGLRMNDPRFPGRTSRVKDLETHSGQDAPDLGPDMELILQKLRARGFCVTVAGTTQGTVRAERVWPLFTASSCAA